MTKIPFASCVAAMFCGSAAAQPAPATAPTIASVPPSAWTPLFNGKDLTGWTAHWVKPGDERPASALFTVENGTIHVYAADVAGTVQQPAYIQTETEHRDYRLSLEYKWGTKKFQNRTNVVRDAGLIYHSYDARPSGWPLGIEAQIQEGDTGDLWGITGRATSTVDPMTLRYAAPKDGGVQVTLRTDGIGDRIAHGALNELPNEWNTLEIVVRGDSAIHIVNGFVNLRATDLKKWDPTTSQWLRLDHGKIGLQAEYAELYYRNVRIRPLTPEEMK